MHEYVEEAIHSGLGEIGLTDHLFLYWLPRAERSLKWAIPESEYDNHYAEMLALRERYRGSINVRIGVEADFVAGHEAELHEVLGRYDFDFVLGSVHFMDGWLIDDPDLAHRYHEERVAEIYRRYFANVRAAIATGAFDILAHFDLPKKFGFLPEEDVSGIIASTLDAAAAAGVAIELSTAGVRKPVAEIYPSPAILRAMRERDIPIVLSSDAHAPSEVGFGYDASIAAARAAGYESLVTFAARERTTARIG